MYHIHIYIYIYIYILFLHKIIIYEIKKSNELSTIEIRIVV